MPSIYTNFDVIFIIVITGMFHAYLLYIAVSENILCWDGLFK